jgi:hypothetical protein
MDSPNWQVVEQTGDHKKLKDTKKQGRNSS